MVDGMVKKASEGILYTAYGVITGIKVGSSQYGEWIAFKGDFIAINEKHEVSSNLIFLPELATNMLEAAFRQSDADSIEFALKIGKKKSDSPIGYEYYIESVLDIKASNRLEDLREKIDTYNTPNPKKDKINKK